MASDCLRIRSDEAAEGECTVRPELGVLTFEYETEVVDRLDVTRHRGRRIGFPRPP